MSERTQWPAATADLFTDAAGIATYIDGEGLDAAIAEVVYRRELAGMRADTGPGAQLVLAKAVEDQRDAVTALLEALVHLGAARWETALDGNGQITDKRRLVIYGPPEDERGRA